MSHIQGPSFKQQSNNNNAPYTNPNSNFQTAQLGTAGNAILGSYSDVNISGIQQQTGNFREKLQARLGNAQLSDSKHYDSYGVEEQENEDDQSSSLKNSGLHHNNHHQFQGGDDDMESEYSNI